MENYTQGNSEIFAMEVDGQARNTFLEMAKWTKFLSILGFISLGFIVLGGFAVAATVNTMSSMYSSQLGGLANVGGAGIIMIYVIIAGLMFYPTYALFKYSTGMKTALRTNNREKFNEAVGHLKGMFKFYGILMIIVLGLYALIFLIGIIAMAGR